MLVQLVSRQCWSSARDVFAGRAAGPGRGGPEGCSALLTAHLSPLVLSSEGVREPQPAGGERELAASRSVVSPSRIVERTTATGGASCGMLLLPRARAQGRG